MKRGDTVAFTGTLSEPRSVWANRAIAAGFVVSDRVDTTTKYLVIGRPPSGKLRPTAKMQAARKLVWWRQGTGGWCGMTCGKPAGYTPKSGVRYQLNRPSFALVPPLSVLVSAPRIVGHKC